MTRPHKACQSLHYCTVKAFHLSQTFLILVFTDKGISYLYSKHSLSNLIIPLILKSLRLNAKSNVPEYSWKLWTIGMFSTFINRFVETLWTVRNTINCCMNSKITLQNILKNYTTQAKMQFRTHPTTNTTNHFSFPVKTLESSITLYRHTHWSLPFCVFFLTASPGYGDSSPGHSCYSYAFVRRLIHAALWNLLIFMVEAIIEQCYVTFISLQSIVTTDYPFHLKYTLTYWLTYLLKIKILILFLSLCSSSEHLWKIHASPLKSLNKIDRNFSPKAWGHILWMRRKCNNLSSFWTLTKSANSNFHIRQKRKQTLVEINICFERNIKIFRNCLAHFINLN